MTARREPNHLREGLARYLAPAQIRKLASTCVGIAGAGGLGSNIAMLLARSGVEEFLLIDCDSIEASNLNRQHYWPAQIGQTKVDAIARHLLELNPAIRLSSSHLRLQPGNMDEIISRSHIWIEALDNGETKKIFVERALLAGKRVFAASGIAGYGGPPLLRREIGNLTVIGDFSSSINNQPPLAPKVAQAAAMMADCVLQHVLK